MQDSASKPGGDVKASRVKKRPASGRARTNGNTHPEQPVASSSKLPAPGQSEKRRRGKESRRVQALDEQMDIEALDASAWTCVPLAQHEVSTVPPVWSRDGRFYFSVSGNSVHVHSSNPPAYNRLSTLSSTHPEGHTRAITALLLSPTNPFHLITTSEDGSVKLWDWVEGRLVRTIYQSKHLQILHACIGRVSGSHWLFATMSMEKSTKPKNPNASTARYHVARIPLNGRNIRQDAYPPLGKLSSAPSALLISPRNTYLVALAGAKAYTFRLPARFAEALPANWKPACVKFVSDHLFTCGAFSPDAVAGKASGEEWFATGDVKGVIRLWHGLDDAFQQLEASAAIAPLDDNGPSSHHSDTEKRLPTTVLHWHAHAVAGIAFTPSGAQLLSVGEESVLVQWHLASGKREYIPRLGGRSIISLAVKEGSRSLEEEWWMTLVDGSSVRVGASTGKATTVGSNVKLDPLRPAATDSPYPLAVHPALRAVVVPSSHPSTLQFVDPIASSILFDLEVVPSNRVAKREDEEVESVAVENMAFAETADGPTRWMATIEGRKGDEQQGGGKVKNLKIWQWVGETYIVNTQFPRPHGYGDISAVMFSSSRGSDRPPVLVTTSEAGEAKVWYARQAPKSEHGKIAKSNSPQTEMYWSARSTFSYRSLPIYAAAISPDSTIVALTHGAVITLWDLATNALLSTLDSSAFDVHHLVFVGNEGRSLAAAGKGSGVALWDLLSCDCAWSAPTQKAEHLLAGRDSGFYVLSSDAGATKVASFDIGSHVPKQIHTVDQALREVCILPPTGSSASSEDLFIGVAPSGEVYRFGPSVSDFAKQGAKSVSQSGEKSTSIWQEMFGKAAFFEETGAFDTEAPTVAIPRPGKGRPAEVFNGPSHTLPPVGMLFDAFMDEFIASSTVPSREKESAAPNGDILYEQDEDQLDVTRSNKPRSAETKYRSVDKDDMKEVEELFKGLLSQPPNPPVVKPQGLPNGTPAVAKRAVSSTFTPATASPASGKKAPVAKSLPATPKTPNGMINGDMSSEEDIGQELPSSKKKDRGKKRKAPREE